MFVSESGVLPVEYQWWGPLKNQQRLDQVDTAERVIAEITTLAINESEQLKANKWVQS